MKKILFLCMTIFALSYTSAQVTAYQVGDVVDNFTVTDTHGVEHNLYDITATEKYVFLDFFFRNCGPCQQTSRYFYQLFNEYGSNQEHTYMISLSPYDNNATIQEFEDLFNGGFTPCPAAGTEGGAPPVITNFGINAFPTYAIIAPDNTLAVADIWPVSGMETFVNAFPQGLIDLLMMSTNDISSQNGFSVYPSISNGNFTVSLSKSSNSDISIFDMTGKKVFSGNYQSQDVNLSVKLTPGIYILNVNAEGKTSSKKIIIRN